MNGPAGADIKWKGIAARPFKVVVLVELAAQARKEGCAQSDAARVPVAVWQAALRACQCTPGLLSLPGHDTRRLPAVSSQTSGLMCLRSGSVCLLVRQEGIRWHAHPRRARRRRHCESHSRHCHLRIRDCSLSSEAFE